jgi:hypothetical protein
MASLNYQVGTAEVSTFTDIPAGDYAMLFTESEVKDTADRTGQFIVLKGTIIEGQYINRVFFVEQKRSGCANCTGYTGIYLP